MFRKHDLLSYLRFAIVPVLLYSIIAIIFLWKSAFQATYILYIGNMLFGVSIAVFIWLLNKKGGENESTGRMIFAGHITAVMAILIICIMDVILIYSIPSNITGVIQASSPELQASPPQLGHLNRGIFILLFMNTIVGNISTGSFMSIIFPYIIKRNQKDYVDASNKTK